MFHKLHVIPPSSLKYKYTDSSFAVKTILPDHALMLQCVLFCLQVLHTNLESSLQVEDPEHELQQ